MNRFVFRGYLGLIVGEEVFSDFDFADNMSLYIWYVRNPLFALVAASCTFTVRRRCEDGCPVVRVNTPGLLQQSHVWYC